jgi:Putative peptidoglycan binding domain
MQMTGTKTALSRAAVAGASILAVFLCARRAQAQTGTEGATYETIKVTDDKPVSKAMDVIGERYGVMIDYMDPPYVAPQDLELVRSLHGKPLKVPYQAPKMWTLTVHYWQVPGMPGSVAPIYRCKAGAAGCKPVTTRPHEGIATLIQQVLHQFAEQGGQVFTVRRLEMPYGARWEVYPIYARHKSGKMVAQPDLLRARISIPKARRWPWQMGKLIVQQLNQAWGTKGPFAWLGWAVYPHLPRPGEQPPELGAENVSAWRAIADMMGPRGTLGVLRVRYGMCNPDCGWEYGVNIARLPYRYWQPPRPPTPVPQPARALPPRDIYPAGWLQRAHMPEGIREVQQTLAKLGYLGTPPTAHWDENAIAALKRFQLAAGLPETGKFDLRTAMKLWPSLPRHLIPVTVRATPAMSVALGEWLNTTRDGRKEVQRALAKAGFYNGPINGKPSLPMSKALEAFQTANGLKPTGVFDWETAVKLSPLLPQPKK